LLKKGILKKAKKLLIAVVHVGRIEADQGVFKDQDVHLIPK
jgi:hypothetical protein